MALVLAILSENQTNRAGKLLEQLPALSITRKDRAMTKRSLPSPETLRKLLRYEPETGKLFWRERPVDMFTTSSYCDRWNSRYAGYEAFTSKNGKGYLVGRILGRTYRAHRVIWAMETGSWPVDQIDHEDHDRSNNRFKNLREVSNAENSRNMSLSCRNSSGIVGVHWNKQREKWHAQILVAGCNIYLGLFDDLSDATAARRVAEIKYKFHENHGAVSLVSCGHIQ